MSDYQHDHSYDDPEGPKYRMMEDDEDELKENKKGHP